MHKHSGRTRHLSINLPDEIFDRLERLVKFYQAQYPLKEYCRTDIFLKVLADGLRIVEARE